MIDKKRLIKSLTIISLIIIIVIAVIQITRTLARYETTATTERDVEVAFWVVDNDFKSDTIFINDIYPRTNPFEYAFTVSNFSGTKKAETDLEYEILITTTTNLPLSYEIQKDGITCTEEEQLYKDTNGTYYRRITLKTTESQELIMDSDSDTTHNYVLKVTFPQENSAYLQYADLMQDVKIDLTARQVIEEEVANT